MILQMYPISLLAFQSLKSLQFLLSAVTAIGGVSQIALEATDMGRLLYEKYRIVYKK